MALFNFEKNNEYLITLQNSGNLVVDFKKYANDFFDGAERIIHYLSDEAAERQDIAKLDLWYFAMLYLYRQSLELLLKSTIFKYVTQKEDRKTIIGEIRHDLKEGLDMLLEKIPDNEKYDNDAEINWLLLFFEDISRVDKDSDMFRYPFGNNLQILFDKQTHISLLATHENMNRAYSILNTIHECNAVYINEYESYEPQLFIEGGHYYQQSVVGYNYLGQSFYPYFTSYEEVGKHLEDLIKKEKYQDMFLPMCYIFRNAVELGLKQLIVEDSHIPREEALKVLKKKKHSLVGLWNKIEAEIEQYANAPKGDTTIIDTRKYIQAFHDFDNSSDIFRYPTNRNLDTYFSTPKTFDMMNIAACFHELCNFLSGVDSMLSEIKDYEAEMRSYYSDEMNY